MGLLLAGCTASWQAPLESRGGTRKNTHKPPTQIGKYHRVQAGETLYAIAWQAGTDYQTLAGWNGIRAPYVIRTGQLIRMVPPPKRQSAPKPREPVKVQPSPVAPRQVQQVTKPPPRRQEASLRTNNKVLTWGWPTKGQVLSTFSANDLARKGIKIGGRLGQPINSTAPGHVVYSGSGLIGYGRLIIIKHNDKYLSAYGHNDELLVKEGDQVGKGQQIARMGKDNSGQSMLHFEIRYGGKPTNPLSLLPRQ